MQINKKNKLVYLAAAITATIFNPIGAKEYKIGLCVMATGRYIKFVKPLIESARSYFCTNHDVHYFVFTDGQLEQTQNITRLEQSRLGWPYDTMMRFEIYYKHKDILHEMDYLFSCDADMLFVDYIGDEILSERVATQHPGFVGKRGSYENNPISKACISSSEGKQYFAGGFYGGTATEFLRMAYINSTHINQDLAQNFIAVWHDESHHNRYMVDHEPTLILNPSYCYPEHWTLPYPKKLLALDKDHAEMRRDA